MTTKMERDTILARAPGSITFAVDDVVPAVAPLPTVSTQLKMARLSRENMHSIGDPDSMVIQGHNVHALLEAVHLAYAEHRPLVLTPDILWLAVCQGLAYHIRNNAELLRERIVLHDGVQELVAPYDATEPNWPVAIDRLRASVGAEAPQLHDLVMQRFSTTGRDEWMAYCGALFEMASQYFGYQVFPICGIPRITLHGTPEDWAQMSTALAGLKRYGLQFWLDRLEPIVAQCEAAAGGQVDRTFWQRMYHHEPECAVVYVSGWIGQLFPYIRGETGGGKARSLYSRRNPLLDKSPPKEGVKHTEFPSGLNRVLLRDHAGAWPDRGMVSGFIGSAQDSQSFALQPKIGWGLFRTRSPEPAIDQLRLSLYLPGVDSAQLRQLTLDEGLDLPPALAMFYRAGNGGRVSLPGGHLDLHPVEALRSEAPPGQEPSGTGGRFQNQLVHFGTFSDRAKLYWVQGSHWAETVFVRYRKKDGMQVVAVTLNELVEGLTKPTDKGKSVSDFLKSRRGF